MGNHGGGGCHVHYNHVTVPVQRGPTDAEIQEQIRVQNQRQAQAIAAAERLQQQKRQLIRQAQERQRVQRQNFLLAQKEKFQNYLVSLRNISFKQAIPVLGKGERHYAVIGPISSGKTTLLNSIFDLNEETGTGQTTTDAKPVYKDYTKKLIVWDVPGINKDFTIYDPTNLAFFAGCQKIFVIYKDSPKRCDKIIQVLNAIKPGGLYLVRSQCDNWNSEQFKTLEQERNTDRQILKEWGINAQQFYQYSSYKFGYDNAQLKQVIST